MKLNYKTCHVVLVINSYCIRLTATNMYSLLNYSKADFLVFISVVVIVIAVLHLGSNLAAPTGKAGQKGDKTKNPVHKDHQQTMNSASSHTTHDMGEDNDRPGNPFFWIHGKISGPEMLAVWNPIEEELKSFSCSQIRCQLHQKKTMQPKKIYKFKSQFFLLPVQLMQER